MARYLVTGGLGFVGSNLTDALIEDGHEVVIIDNLSTGKKENLNPKAHLIVADFTRLDEIKDHFKNIDGVFHVGALPRIPFSIEHPIESTEANLMGTLNVLVAARDNGVKRVVYSASSSAYGNKNELPLRPDMPADPLNPYALQKYVGEVLCKQFYNLYDLQTVSLRYFNLYGPRMADDGAYVPVMSVFKKQTLNHEPLTIVGDGEQARDFTHVSDAVRANILAMQSDKVGHGEVLNIGNGEMHSVNEIADYFGGEKINLPARKGEMRFTKADNSKTRELLGWEPQVSFAQGMERLLKEIK